MARDASESTSVEHPSLPSNRLLANRSLLILSGDNVLLKMQFKPFKPPLIRKQPQVPHAQQRVPESDHEPSAKRRRISDESVGLTTEESKSDALATARPILANVSIYRKPLTLVNNSSNAPKRPIQDASGDEGAEGYYNVLWLIYISI